MKLLLENLTESQQETWRLLLENCFPFRMTEQVMWSTSSLGKAIQCRTDNVEKTLLRISRRLGGVLRLQRARPDSRNRPISLESDEVEKSKRGGRKKRTYKAVGHPLEGNAIWLRLWLDK